MITSIQALFANSNLSLEAQSTSTGTTNSSAGSLFSPSAGSPSVERINPAAELYNLGQTNTQLVNQANQNLQQEYQVPAPPPIPPAAQTPLPNNDQQLQTFQTELPAAVYAPEITMLAADLNALPDMYNTEAASSENNALFASSQATLPSLNSSNNSSAATSSSKSGSANTVGSSQGSAPTGGTAQTNSTPTNSTPPASSNQQSGTIIDLKA